jgi:hypothetical protein
MSANAARTDLVSGPSDYYRDDVAVSRGQWADIARLALELLGLPIPRSRYDATVTTVRLRAGVEQRPSDTPTEVPQAW